MKTIIESTKEEQEQHRGATGASVENAGHLAFGYTPLVLHSRATIDYHNKMVALLYAKATGGPTPLFIPYADRENPTDFIAVFLQDNLQNNSAAAASSDASAPELGLDTELAGLDAQS